MTVSDLKKYIEGGKKGHLVGIGGVSMSPLAEALNSMGLEITGSDMSESDAVRHLRKKGIQINIGHSEANIDGAQFIIRTAAARDDNPEIMAARERNIPVFERAQGWGYIMQKYKNALCISGTHGKTTTTSMATHILLAAGSDPTVMIGGTLPKLQSGHRIGGGNTIVLESCEYYNSFHSFFPTIAVILNIEADHLDFFKDLDEVKHSFRAFAENVPADGVVIANFDDANTMDALSGIDKHLMTFGMGEGADVRAINLESLSTSTEFDVLFDDRELMHITLNLPGRHNVSDALAAITAALYLKLPKAAIIDGLAEFGGAVRRFECKGSFNGADIYDDYAHHPSELGALLDAVSELDYDRVILAFQPHTYTRTMNLFDQFVTQLKRPDVVLLAEIYAARERNTIGITSGDLAKKIPGSVYCRTFSELETILRNIARPGDIILTVGAGDIYKVGEALTGV